MPISSPTNPQHGSNARVDAPGCVAIGGNASGHKRGSGDVAHDDDRESSGAKRQRVQLFEQRDPRGASATPAAGDAANVQGAFRDAVVAGDAGGAQRALQRGAVVDALLQPECVPALSYAAERPQHADVLRVLLVHAPPSSSLHGRTDTLSPLFVAVAAGNLLGVQLLLQCGANPLDARGPDTPYRLAELTCSFTAERQAIFQAFSPYLAPNALSPH